METTHQKTVDLTKMSTEELEIVLAQRKAAENEAKQKDKKQYESERDDSVFQLIEFAKEGSAFLKQLKSDTHVIFDLHADRLAKYGLKSKKSKGGFSLIHSSKDFKIVRTRTTQPIWDERSVKGISLIIDFLEETVKAFDPKVFEVMIGFLQKNQNGELEYPKVMQLFTYKDTWSDKRWTEGLNLLHESYSLNLTGFGYEFHTKDEEGKWVRIDLNFSNI